MSSIRLLFYIYLILPIVSGEAVASVAGAETDDRHVDDTGALRPGAGCPAGAGSESDHDRSSDRSDDLSSREDSSADQVYTLSTLYYLNQQIFCYRRTETVSRAVISVIK